MGQKTFKPLDLAGEIQISEKRFKRRRLVVFPRIGVCGGRLVGMSRPSYNAGFFFGLHIFDFIKLTPEYAIYEIPAPAVWTGKTISNLGVRQHYKVNIIAIKQGNTLNTMPGPDYIFKADDHVIVIGKAGDVFKLSSEK